jgi:hypothetical protein
MDRSNPYEAAFEAYLRDRRIGAVAVDETHRSILADESVKSLDFIVYGPCGTRLLVDVKGRRFPGGPRDAPRRVWESWSTQDDIDGLERWAERFGPGYVPLLVFVYRLGSTIRLPADTPDIWNWRGRDWLIRAVSVPIYRRLMRSRSPRWGTVALPASAFRSVVRPFQEFAFARELRAGSCSA